MQRGGGEYDNQRRIIRNNMAVVDAGRVAPSQIANSDGMILAWDSPGTKILHNTLITNGQIADAIQGRWSFNLKSVTISNDTIRMREDAAYTGANNVLTAQASWFMDSASVNLRLSAMVFLQSELQTDWPIVWMTLTALPAQF